MTHGKPRDPRKEQQWRRLIQLWKNSAPGGAHARGALHGTPRLVGCGHRHNRRISVLAYMGFMLQHVRLVVTRMVPHSGELI